MAAALRNRFLIVTFIEIMILQWWARGIQSYTFSANSKARFLTRLSPRPLRNICILRSSSSSLRHCSKTCILLSKRDFHFSVNNEDDTADPYEACWNTTSFSVNPSENVDIDQILQGLNSPAPQSFFVLERAITSNAAKEDASFKFELEECSYLLKPGWKMLVQKPKITSFPSDGVAWTLLSPSDNARVEEENAKGSILISEGSCGPNACQLSNEALSIVSKAADAQMPIDEAKIRVLIKAMESRLQLTLGTDIRGRTSADMAFSLCLAGIQNEFLFDTLIKVARLEMERVGRRSSRRAKDILHVVEKLAASGVKGREVERVYSLAAKSLELKEEYPDIVKVLSSPGRLDLLSPRPLLWLWRYSSRLQKPSPHLGKPISSQMWLKQFKDPKRPLVIDIGCGLGVSLIGMASQADQSELKSRIGCLNFSECNYLGGDLSEATIRFATSIASRWKLSDRLVYLQSSAEELLDQVDSIDYPGGVSTILLQFPSPWRLKGDGGNSQLPTGPDDGFMVSTALMGKIVKLLKKGNGHGQLIVQTNCEDVAVFLRDRALDFGLLSIPAQVSVESPSSEGRLPERTAEWVRLGGERAIGPEWFAEPVLPDRCATETEVACQIQGTPIHRCVFQTKDL